MSKKIIVIIAIVLLVLVCIGIDAFVLLHNGDNSANQIEQSQLETEQNESNNINNSGGYFMDQDDSSNEVDANNINDSTMGSNTSTITDTVPNPNQTGTSTSTVGQEMQPVAIDMVTNAFTGNNFQNYIASSGDIPSSLHTKDNWVYTVANGGDIMGLLGGSERINVQVENTKVMSSTPQDTLYQIIYRFTARPLEAMSEGDLMMERPGVATALVRVNSQGKIIQYEESVEW